MTPTDKTNKFPTFKMSHSEKNAYLLGKSIGLFKHLLHFVDFDDREVKLPNSVIDSMKEIIERDSADV